jgi:hypothetical protein
LGTRALEVPSVSAGRAFALQPVVSLLVGPLFIHPELRLKETGAIGPGVVKPLMFPEDPQRFDATHLGHYGFDPAPQATIPADIRCRRTFDGLARTGERLSTLLKKIDREPDSLRARDFGELAGRIRGLQPTLFGDIPGLSREIEATAGRFFSHSIEELERTCDALVAGIKGLPASSNSVRRAAEELVVALRTMIGDLQRLEDPRHHEIFTIDRATAKLQAFEIVRAELAQKIAGEKIDQPPSPTERVNALLEFRGPLSTIKEMCKETSVGTPEAQDLHAALGKILASDLQTSINGIAILGNDERATQRALSYLDRLETDVQGALTELSRRRYALAPESK